MLRNDFHTNTIDGAAAYEATRYDGTFEDETSYADGSSEDDDTCNCSDPSCPCDGIKRGQL